MYATPSDAEAAFYTAIEAKDMQAMRDVWLDSEKVTCIHPMGAKLRGRAEVISSWRQIFGNETSLKFDIRDVEQELSEQMAVHILYEHITTARNPNKPAVAVSTNVYELTAEGWKMILHHASIAPDMRQAGEDLKSVLH